MSFNEIFKEISSSNFELHPLSTMYKHGAPMEAIDCGLSAIAILEIIYEKAENSLQNGEKFTFN